MSDYELDSKEESCLVLAQEDRFHKIERLGFNTETREIFVNGVIDSEFGAWFLQILRFLESENNNPITVWLDTSGGDTQSMFTFCDLVRQSSVKITTIGIGNVCSAGVLMLACGHHRMISRHCVMMVHQYAQEGDAGSVRYAEAKERRKWEDWMHRRMIELMSEYSGKPVTYWRGIFEKKPEHWLLGGEDAVEAGLADVVLPY